MFCLVLPFILQESYNTLIGFTVESLLSLHVYENDTLSQYQNKDNFIVQLLFPF